MTKKDIAKRIAAGLGVTEVKARVVIQKALDLIIEAIDEDGRIELRNPPASSSQRARPALNPTHAAEGANVRPFLQNSARLPRKVRGIQARPAIERPGWPSRLATNARADGVFGGDRYLLDS